MADSLELLEHSLYVCLIFGSKKLVLRRGKLAPVVRTGEKLTPELPVGDSVNQSVLRATAKMPQ